MPNSNEIITDPLTEEINRLHDELIESLTTSLKKAIRIGELLTETKDQIPHGGWLPFVREKLPFSERTARDFMRMYRERDRIESASIADLAGARRLLAAPKETIDEVAICDIETFPYSRLLHELVHERGVPDVIHMCPQAFKREHEYHGLPEGCQIAMITVAEYSKDQDFVFVEVLELFGDGGKAVSTIKPIKKPFVPFWLALIPEMLGVNDIKWMAEEVESGRLSIAN